MIHTIISEVLKVVVSYLYNIDIQQTVLREEGDKRGCFSAFKSRGFNADGGELGKSMPSNV